ncbi:MAG: DeoR/GlpR family DNA-binding transcription regulator [Synergistaceae bacterium]|jgi:DeoR/GlpR family transcriptional regulator of sugar metabolism|nr:DeoR/GlpR family DNA-binding transcription regulator [Synergistaceae bacterium]
MNNRQKELITFMVETHYAKVEKLAQKFCVSNETIRRDLKYLEERQFLRRVHGGAVWDTFRAKERELSERIVRNLEEKRAVAHLAESFVNDGDTLVLGTGTTCLEVAKALQSKRNLTIVTNSIEIGVEAVKNDSNNIYMIGGKLRANGLSLSGSFGSQFLSSFRVDTAFISVGGVSLEHGITDFNVEESALARIMLSIASKKILVTDYTKMAVIGLVKICDVSDLDYILTDWNMPVRERVDYHQKAGVKVCIAERR